jgi:putative ABC transport system substrate-binding protein
MKAVGLYRYLPIEHPESLLDLEVETPKPAGRDLLVEVKAVSVNPVDAKRRAPKDAVELAPKILGFDAAGRPAHDGEGQPRPHLRRASEAGAPAPRGRARDRQARAGGVLRNRRLLLAAVAAGLLAPRFALAQAKTANVVLLFAGDSEDDEPAARSFYEEMRRRGWAEGVNIAYHRLYGKGSRTYVEGLASSAAGGDTDLVVTTTGGLAVAVLKETRTVPVVFLTSVDPVTIGLVDSIAKPGRNATGTYQVQGDSVRVRYRLARELLPRAQKVGALYDRRSADVERLKKANQDAAIAAGIDLDVGEFTNFEAVAKILARYRRARIHAVMTSPSFTLLARRREVIALAERNGIAVVGHRVEFAEAGALLSYGPEIAEAQRRSAAIADQILKGARPAEIPVERAVKAELAINRRVALAHGIPLSKALLQRADRVID